MSFVVKATVYMTSAEYDSVEVKRGDIQYIVDYGDRLRTFLGDIPVETLTFADFTADQIDEIKSAAQEAAEQAAQTATEAAASAESSEQDARTYSESAGNYADKAAKAEGYDASAQKAASSALTSAKNANDALLKTIAERILAQSYARGGTNSRPGEDTDNAEYYMRRAQAAAEGVDQDWSYIESIKEHVDEVAEQVDADKDTTEGYKDSALTYRNEAEEFKNQAATSETNALTYKNNAAASATDAASSAGAAAASEVNAAASARAAAVSETNADASDTSAQLAAQAAEYARNGAVDAKVLAEDAQQRAETAAVNAAGTTSTSIETQFRDGLTELSSAVNSAQSAALNATSSQQSAAASAVSAQQSVTDANDILETIRSLISTYYVGPAYGYGVTTDGTLLSFTWTDPEDNVVKWAKTRLVMKQGGFPANETDGVALVDNTVRNQYKDTPFTWDSLAVSDYYFALFTQSTGGAWTTGDDCPRFTTDTLTWQTIAMMSRAGTLLQYPGMAIGSVVDMQTNSLYPKLRWKLAHVDYPGHYEYVQDYMDNPSIRHNSIWIADYLPCLGDSNTAVQHMFDSPENAYGATWDTVFITGKIYYTVDGDVFTAMTAGTDYDNGDSIADWQTEHDATVFTKNHTDRQSSGCNSWLMSNMRQWMQKTGSGWFVPQNEYDVKADSAAYTDGWLTGFDPGFLGICQKVKNKTARNTISTNSGGGGGGYDITTDVFWLPSMKEVFNSNVNNIAEGQQLAYFRDVATTAVERIQRDNGGTARSVWLRSANTSTTRSVYYIYTSGSSNTYYASLAYAFLPSVCVA